MTRFEIYKRHPQLEEPPKFYWRFVAANGKILADGAESYTRRNSCLRAIHTFLALLGMCEADVRIDYVESD